MPLIGVVADRCQRIALMWQWRFWQQVGSPARTVAALNHLLADWDACVIAAEAVSTKPSDALTRYHRSRQGDVAAPPVHLLATRAHALGQLGRWCDARAQLEQLRALEHGIPIRVLHTKYRAIGVDVPNDVRKVERLLSRKK